MLKPNACVQLSIPDGFRTKVDTGDTGVTSRGTKEGSQRNMKLDI